MAIPGLRAEAEVVLHTMMVQNPDLFQDNQTGMLVMALVGVVLEVSVDTLLRGPGMACGTNPTRTKAVLTEEDMDPEYGLPAVHHEENGCDAELSSLWGCLPMDTCGGSARASTPPSDIPFFGSSTSTQRGCMGIQFQSESTTPQMEQGSASPVQDGWGTTGPRICVVGGFTRSAPQADEHSCTAFRLGGDLYPDDRSTANSIIASEPNMIR